MNKLEIKSQTCEELSEQLNDIIKIDKYRIKQILHGIYKMKYDCFTQMSNIPISIKNILTEKYFFTKPKIILCNDSEKNMTTKYLFELMDGLYIESVLMKYKYGYSLCVSTQVGCKMACKFCMSSDNNFKRNLSAGEMTDQIIYIEKDKKIKISRIVLMGIGEPLDNFDNVIKFIKIITDIDCLNFSMRHITLSTSGIVEKIYKLANIKMNLTLSISLHSSNNETRNNLMPINIKNNINELLNSCKYYFNITKRRITFEYILMDKINDTLLHASELCQIIKKLKIPIHINLIKLNENELSKTNNIFPSNNTSIFFNELKKNSINVTVRRILGDENKAACGQLRSYYDNKTI